MDFYQEGIEFKKKGEYDLALVKFKQASASAFIDLNLELRIKAVLEIANTYMIRGNYIMAYNSCKDLSVELVEIHSCLSDISKFFLRTIVCAWLCGYDMEKIQKLVLYFVEMCSSFQFTEEYFFVQLLLSDEKNYNSIILKVMTFNSIKTDDLIDDFLNEIRMAMNANPSK